MDLSKACDCIPPNLLIAKLEYYGVDKASLRNLLDYVTRRKQWTKIGSSFSSWCDINIGVPHMSILAPPLFNIFINDLCFSIKKFADDNTLFCGDKNFDLVFFNLNSDLSNVMDWLKINSLKANPRKFQFMVLGAIKNDYLNLNMAAKVILSSSEVKLLGITIDYELKFKKHINELGRKASYKLHALHRIRRFIS